MLCGRTPFAGGHPWRFCAGTQQPPPPIPGIPSALRDYLGLLLAKDPRSRPKAATEAAAALAPLESSLASLPAPPPMQAPGHGVTPASAIPGGQSPRSGLWPTWQVQLLHRDRGHAADENSNGQHHSPGVDQAGRWHRHRNAEHGVPADGAGRARPRSSWWPRLRPPCSCRTHTKRLPVAWPLPRTMSFPRSSTGMGC